MVNTRENYLFNTQDFKNIHANAKFCKILDMAASRGSQNRHEFERRRGNFSRPNRFHNNNYGRNYNYNCSFCGRGSGLNYYKSGFNQPKKE